MKIQYQTVKCTNCGSTLSINAPGSAYFYGSPIRSCPKCGRQYLDKNYHEIEIDGIQKTDISNKGAAGLLIGSLAAAVIFGVLFIFFLSRGRLHFGTLIATVISLLIFIFGLVDAIKIKSGSKQKELEKEHQQSILRLQNKEYAHTLKKLGYQVPEKYL